MIIYQFQFVANAIPIQNPQFKGNHSEAGDYMDRDSFAFVTFPTSYASASALVSSQLLIDFGNNVMVLELGIRSRQY